MKFAFAKDLDHQLAAIDAVTGLFAGQEALRGTSGCGNRLCLDADTILANLRDVQNRAGLAPEPSLDSMNFTIEMETGTGKTYVYLRTIYELNQLYGFTKFVVVVPSVAIKEGTAGSVDMLREHFGALYGNPPVQAFQHDAGNISRIRAFAASSGVEIMIVTAAAINKRTNRIHQAVEELDFERPIDLIRATEPVVIVDEPQSVYGDDGPASRKAGAGRWGVGELNPLAVLRYSATHAKHDKGNLLYRLDAIAAYEKQLVKQIEIDSLVTESSTQPYVRLLGVRRAKSGFTARVEVDVAGGGRKGVTVDTVDRRNLATATKLTRYERLNIVGISAVPGAESVTFDTVAEPLRVGDALGEEVSPGERARQMIAQTIRQHLRKEREFALQGRKIKVLSLFFVDSVAKYRVYQNGEAQPGEYATIFEEEYARIADEPIADARRSHQGYFSVDRKATGERLVDTSESSEKGRQQAGLAYEQIMRNKVELTTPGTPIRFVFSHSALQEGWDNPNVFQICVLRNMGTERWRRQSVGRGLRLCVDGNGDRQHGFAINRLTVIANESYEEFAEQLQRELAEDLGIEFGVATVDGFARLQYRDGDGQMRPVGAATAESVLKALRHAGYVDAQGKVEDSLRAAVRSPELKALVDSVAPRESGVILGLIKRLAKPLDVTRADRHVDVIPERPQSPELIELWNRISHRTEYRVNVDEAALRKALVEALHDIAVPERTSEWRTNVVQRIDHSGLSANTAAVRHVGITRDEDLPDILSVLADQTRLTRSTLAHVLTESGTLPRFRRNPQAYLTRASALIKSATARLLVNGLRYELVERHCPPLPREARLSGSAEQNFALHLRERADVKAFVKLPPSFQVATPLGTCTPDWALVVERAEGDRHLVLDTKGATDKIDAVRLHFAAMGVEFHVVDSVEAVDRCLG